MHDGSRQAVPFSIKQHFDLKEVNLLAREDSAYRMQELVREVHTSLRDMVQDLAVLQDREKSCSPPHHVTGRRMLHLSLISVIVLAGTAVLQLMNFESYSQRKKLI